MYQSSFFTSLDGYDREEKRQKGLLNVLTDRVYDFFINRAAKYGYEERLGQQDMALDIADAIRDHEHIIIEAGVGIGKSFAYIVPLLYYQQLFNEPVAIATSTITLQEQLLSDIQKISGLLHHPTEVVLAKGQTHFVCRHRADVFLEGKKGQDYANIRSLLKEGIFDQKHFNLPAAIWNVINVNNFQYKTCQKCVYKSSCGYLNLREKMQHTYGVILCNQDLLTMHLRKLASGQRPLLNPQISVIVVDEAHNLEDKVRASLTADYTADLMMQKVREARKAIRQNGTDIDKNLNRLQDSLARLFGLFEKQIREQRNYANHDLKYADRFFLELNSTVRAVISEAAGITSAINDTVGLYYHDLAAGEYAIEGLEDVTSFLQSLNQHPDEQIYWLEEHGGRGAGISTCPKNIGDIVRKLYFNEDLTTILTSATIATRQTGSEADKYAYFVKSIDFPAKKGIGYLSEPKPSPFPYDEHAMVYYSNDLPHPNYDHEQFVEQGVKRIVRLLEITDGKALILFTAKTDLEEVYLRLKALCPPYTLLTQRNDASQDQVLSEFRKNTNSVLLGTGAYWEGINIEGKSLSNLIIFRLPFPIPDPVIEYKRSIAQNPLMDVNVPQMIIKIKQGVGRLIRSSTDKGIVSILDPRVSDTSKSPYKELVWESLPIKNKTDNLEKLNEFYTKTVAGGSSL